MAAAPLACLDPLLTGLGSWLERSAHDGLTQDDFTVYATPEGLLSSEVVPEGVYVPEVVVSKNVRKARGRFKVRGSGRRGGCVCCWVCLPVVGMTGAGHSRWWQLCVAVCAG